ncbi:MAG: phosphatase PAP2 family protein [Armatimonadetes bacterium]|nr:phosphatase PAP2 family protein [Armatimonadota bacterium]
MDGPAPFSFAGETPARGRERWRCPVDFSVCFYLGSSSLLLLVYDRTFLALFHLAAIVGLMRLRALALKSSAAPALRLVHAWHAPASLLAINQEIGYMNRLVWEGRYFDDLVMGWEQALFGTSPAVWLSEAAGWYWFSEYLHLCYMLWWIFIPALGLPLYLTGRRREFETFLAACVNALFLCYLCQTFFPVEGPRELFPPLDERLRGPMWALCHWIMERGAAVGTAFPSGHVTLSLVMLACAWRWQRRAYWLLLPIATGTILATVYCRFHYAVDGLAGLWAAAVAYGWLGPVLLERLRDSAKSSSDSTSTWRV